MSGTDRGAPTLLVASHNKKKLAELLDLLRGENARLVSLAEIGTIPEPAEDGLTFAENAAKKALAYAAAAGLPTLADDSGLEVDAIGGAPGVHSARYAATGDGNASDEANRAKLIAAIVGIPPAKRTARFRCAIAVAHRGAVALVSDGSVEGTLLDRERGTGGFGYDPLFVPIGHARTFAEMSSAEKAALSHRGRALAAIRTRLIAWLSHAN